MKKPSFKWPSSSQDKTSDSADHSEAPSENESPSLRERGGESLQKWKSRSSSLTANARRYSGETFDRIAQSAETTKEALRSNADRMRQHIGDIDFSQFSEREFYTTKISQVSSDATVRLRSFYNEQLEVSRDVDEVVEELDKYPETPPEDLASLLDQCKSEAAQQVIGVFALHGAYAAQDDELTEQYSNLSMSYAEFDDANDVRGHANFAGMEKARDEAKENKTSLSDGYNNDADLSPERADIEHVVSAHEQYDSILARATTTDDELISLINREDNLVFTDRSVNRSKGQDDLADFLERRGTPVEGTDKVEIEINDTVYEIDRNDTDRLYDIAKSAENDQKIEQLGEMGFDIAESGQLVAAKQVIGHVIYETHDIFFDELKDVINSGIDISDDNFAERVCNRAEGLKSKLWNRLDERGVIANAKAKGMEGFISGTVSVLPMLVLSTIARLPAFVLTIIRECTLAVVRSARAVIKGDDDRMRKVRIILVGAVTSVFGLYLTRQIATALYAVPGVNVFAYEVASVVSGVLVTAISLFAIYYFWKNKDRLSNLFQPRQPAAE